MSSLPQTLSVGQFQAEEWRDVPGYEGFYQVSDQGRVKSERLNNPGFVSRIRVPRDSGGGYLAITLSKYGEQKTFMVHRLVLLAFVGPCPDDHQGDHVNFNTNDNRIQNLRYLPTKVNQSRRRPLPLITPDQTYKRNVRERNEREILRGSGVYKLFKFWKLISTWEDRAAFINFLADFGGAE